MPSCCSLPPTPSRDIDKGLATLDAAINRLPADKTRQLRELRVIMLAQGKRTSEVEVGPAQPVGRLPHGAGLPGCSWPSSTPARGGWTRPIDC